MNRGVRGVITNVPHGIVCSKVKVVGQLKLRHVSVATSASLVRQLARRACRRAGGRSWANTARPSGSSVRASGDHARARLKSRPSRSGHWRRRPRHPSACRLSITPRHSSSSASGPDGVGNGDSASLALGTGSMALAAAAWRSPARRYTQSLTDRLSASRCSMRHKRARHERLARGLGLGAQFGPSGGGF